MYLVILVFRLAQLVLVGLADLVNQVGRLFLVSRPHPVDQLDLVNRPVLVHLAILELQRAPWLRLHLTRRVSLVGAWVRSAVVGQGVLKPGTAFT